ncbi:hypothetical protein ABQJ48_25370 [Paraburkholderia sp. DGU8]
MTAAASVATGCEKPGAGVPENALALSTAALRAASSAAVAGVLDVCALSASTTSRQFGARDVQSSARAACENANALNRPALAASSARQADAAVMAPALVALLALLALVSLVALIAPVAPRRPANSDAAVYVRVVAFHRVLWVLFNIPPNVYRNTLAKVLLWFPKYLTRTGSNLGAQRASTWPTKAKWKCVEREQKGEYANS